MDNNAKFDLYEKKKTNEENRILIKKTMTNIANIY